MSIFSSKKKTVVGLTTVPLIPEQSFFNESIIGAIFSNTSIAASLSAELRNGWVGKANTFYRQVKSKLPSDTGRAVFTSISNPNTLQNILEDVLGFPISILENTLSQFDVTYSAYQYIIDNYTYDVDTGVITGVSTGPVTFTSAEKINGKLVISYLASDESVITEEVDSFIDNQGEYFHLFYVKASDPSTPLVWLYDVSTDAYPEINNTITTKNYNDYFPSIIIRKDKVNTVDQDNEYKYQANKILKRMGVDLGFITDQILTNENDNNSDVIDDAFLTFSLNIQDKYEGSIVYLYEYFNRIYDDVPNSKEEFDSWEADRSGPIPEHYIKYVDENFNTFVGWNYISKEIKSGTLENKYERETQTADQGFAGFGQLYEKSSFILRKKLTEDTYEEIIVNGLYHITDIVSGKYVVRTLEDSLKEPTPEDEADSAFYIPLSKTVVDNLSLTYRKQVLYASFVIPLYTIQVVKIKWYQRGAFKALLTIIAIVITIATLDPNATALQIAIAVTSQVISAIIIGQILQIAVDILGIDNALILAVIATTVSIYSGGFSPDGLLWAKQLLQISTMSFQAISNEIADEFVKLQNEISNFLQTASEIQEDIDNAEALLDNSRYNFYEVSKGRMYFNPYETPDQFYGRSIYNQNPGVQSFDLLYNYVDRMLKLPEHKYI